MSKRINSYQAVAAFVRGFFELMPSIMDATIEGNDFQKKNDPKEVKQMMLEHYGEVNQYFFDIMFSTSCASTTRRQRKPTSAWRRTLRA